MRTSRVSVERAPDLRIEVQSVVAEGDLAAVRSMLSARRSGPVHPPGQAARASFRTPDGDRPPRSRGRARGTVLGRGPRAGGSRRRQGRVGHPSVERAEHPEHERGTGDRPAIRSRTRRSSIPSQSAAPAGVRPRSAGESRRRGPGRGPMRRAGHGHAPPSGHRADARCPRSGRDVMKCGRTAETGRIPADGMAIGTGSANHRIGRTDIPCRSAAAVIEVSPRTASTSRRTHPLERGTSA